MNYRYFLFMFYIMSNTSLAANNDWTGKWKVNDKNRYMSFTIDNTDTNGLTFSYDEGIGINGVSINEPIEIINNKKGIVKSIVHGSKCNLQLLRVNNNIILSDCELETNAESGGGKVFVPYSQKLYYKASFNCAKASTIVEVGICESKVIANADKKLGSVYKTLRKKSSIKDNKRLRKEQRRWIKTRNYYCITKKGEALNYCLRKHYGQRLLSLNLLNTYKIWTAGNINYALFNEINKARKNSNTKSYFNAMDNGLGLWLSGMTNRRLIDTGSYDISRSFTNTSHILSGAYQPNPNEGFDPHSFNNKIFVEFSADQDIWLGLVDGSNRLIYIPKDKIISSASEKFKSWVKDFDEPKIVNIF